MTSVWRARTTAMLIATAVSVSAAPPAHADALGRATAAYNHGDYVRAARELSVLAAQGNLTGIAYAEIKKGS